MVVRGSQPELFQVITDCWNLTWCHLGRREEWQVWSSAGEDAGQTLNSGCVLVLPCTVWEHFLYKRKFPLVLYKRKSVNKSRTSPCAKVRVLSAVGLEIKIEIHIEKSAGENPINGRNGANLSPWSWEEEEEEEANPKTNP